MVKYIHVNKIKNNIQNIKYKTGDIKSEKTQSKIIIYLIGKWVFYIFSEGNFDTLELKFKSYLRKNKIDNDGFYYRFNINNNIVSNNRKIDDKIKLYCKKVKININSLFSYICIK